MTPLLFYVLLFAVGTIGIVLGILFSSDRPKPVITTSVSSRNDTYAEDYADAEAWIKQATAEADAARAERLEAMLADEREQNGAFQFSVSRNGDFLTCRWAGKDEMYLARTINLAHLVTIDVAFGAPADATSGYVMVAYKRWNWTGRGYYWPHYYGGHYDNRYLYDRVLSGYPAPMCNGVLTFKGTDFVLTAPHGRVQQVYADILTAIDGYVRPAVTPDTARKETV